VDEAIAEFAEHDRASYVEAARAVANDAKRAAMKAK